MPRVEKYSEMKDSGIPWVGRIPASWSVVRAKSIFRNVSEKGHPDAEVLSLYRDYGIVPKHSRDDNHNVTSLDTSSYKFVEPGDLVLNKMKTWQGSLAVSDYSGIVSPAYYVCKFISDSVSKRYIHYLLRTKQYAQEYERLSTGMRIGQWDLGINDFMSVPILLPSLPEQAAISEYLDAECFSIDQLIEEAKASIEEYKAWKSSIIYEAVTKGLDPNAEMKDSGIEWIGAIPSSWKIVRLKNVTDFMPKSNHNLIDSEAEVTFTPMECIRTGTFENRKKLYGEVQGSYTQYSEGDIVLAKVTPCFENGNVCIMKGLYSRVGFGSSELFVIRPQKIVDRYLLYFFQHEGFKQAACATMTGTGGLKRVSSSFVQNCHIPFPSTVEQAQIADYLDDKCEKINALIAEKESLISDLELFKKSLVFEVVTGKRRVC